MNPKCQKCQKKDICKNKTLCAYMYEDNIPQIIEPLLKNTNTFVISGIEVLQEDIFKAITINRINCIGGI